MKKRLKQLLIGIGILLCTLVFLSVGTIYYLKTNHALRLVQGKVNDLIPGAILCEVHGFSLIKGEFELRRVSIKDPSGVSLAGFDRLYIDLSWTTLLRGDLTVATLILDGPWADVQIDKTGKINLMRAFPSSKAKEEGSEGGENGGIPINIVLKSLKLMRGSIRYKVVADDLKAAVQGIELTANGNLIKRSGNFNLMIGDGRLDSPKIRTELDGFRLEATLNEDRIAPLELQVSTPSTKLTLSGNIADILDSPLPDLDLHIAISLPEARKALSLEPTLTGRVSTRITIQGTPDNPRVTFNSAYGGGVLLGQQVDRIGLDWLLKDRFLTINSLQADVASGYFNLNGEVDLKDAFVNGFLDPQRDLEAISYRFFLKQKGIRLEKLIFGGNPLGGVVDSDLSLNGKGISPQTLSANIAMELSAKDLTAVPDTPPIDFHIKTVAGLKKGIGTVEYFEAKAGDIKIQTEGNLDLSSKEVKAILSLDAPNLNGPLAAVGVREVFGMFGLKANVSGSLKQPVLDLVIQGDNLRFQDVTIGDIRLNTNLDQSGRLDISRFTLENKGSAIQGSGWVQIFRETMALLKDLTFQVKLKGDDILIEDFVDNFKGKLSIDAFCEGSATQPKGRVKLYGTDLDLGIQKLKAVRLLSKFDGEKVWLTPLQVFVAPGEIIETKGWFSLQKAFELSIVSEGISLHNIDKAREQKVAEGKMALSISGKGTLGDPQIEGEIGLTNLRINGKSLENINIHLDLRDRLALIQGKLNFDLNGSYHLQKKDFSVSIILDETDLSPYFKMASQPDLSGILTGKVEARGNMEAVDNLVFFADISKMDIFFKEKELVHTNDFKIAFEEKEISIPALNLVILKEGKVDIKGKGKLNGPLDLRMEGHIPLEVARPFVEDLADISGYILLSAAIDGTLEHPEIDAKVELESIGLTVPVLEQRLHDLNGSIRITPQTVSIDKIDGRLDTGNFDLAGKIDLDAFQPVKALIHLNTNAIPLKVPDMLNMLLTTELKLHGNREKSLIEGDVVILEGTYYKDVNLSLIRAVRQKKREEAPLPKEIIQPFFKNMSLDISVKRRNPFLVDNNLAFLDINPDIRISGNLNNPILSGRAAINSGTIHYQKKTFIVKEGFIDFLNPYKIEPTLDIKSEVKIRNWMIFLEISGTPDQLIFKLTSDPPEEEGDIISLLLLGKTTRELIEGEGGSSQSTAQMLAELISSTFGEDIKRATGLDILEVETQGEGDEDSSDRIKVTIGKKLSKRMTMKYATETKDGEISQRAIAEYKFLENILMGGFQDSKGIFGGELQFRLEFR